MQRTANETPNDGEQALRIRLPFVERQDARERIYTLEDELDRVLGETATGELDGEEFGDGSCTVYIYGPSAEGIFAAIHSTLLSARLPNGSCVIKRYGPPGAPQERIPINVPS